MFAPIMGFRFQSEWEGWHKPKGWISSDRREFQRLVDRHSGYLLLQLTGAAVLAIFLSIFLLKWLTN